MNSPPLPTRTGILVVLSAPSGAGKTTLRTTLRADADLLYSVSCTTRPPRKDECDGRDYHFLSPEEFQRRADAGEFLEHARVHGYRYGTLKAPVLENLRAGRDLLLDLDIAGAATIRSIGNAEIAAALVDIFLLPPDFAELRQRLLRRGTESEEEIQTRLRTAAEEMKHWKEFRYAIPSGTIAQTLSTFRAILQAERCLARRLTLPDAS